MDLILLAALAALVWAFLRWCQRLERRWSASRPEALPPPAATPAPASVEVEILDLDPEQAQIDHLARRWRRVTSPDLRRRARNAIRREGPAALERHLRRLAGRERARSRALAAAELLAAAPDDLLAAFDWPNVPLRPDDPATVEYLAGVLGELGQTAKLRRAAAGARWTEVRQRLVRLGGGAARVERAQVAQEFWAAEPQQRIAAAMLPAGEDPPSNRSRHDAGAT